MYTYIYIYNIPGKDKSLKVAESLFRASEVVNSDGGGYGFSLYKYIYIYGYITTAPSPRLYRASRCDRVFIV